jgi:glucosamine-6-phosphate deaminase
MEVIICAAAQQVGETAADKVSRVAARVGPEVVIGLSTGSSPLATYADLARRVDAGTLNLTRAFGFALDEYVGLPTGHPQSYAAVINQTVTVPLKMDPSRVHSPDGFADDIAGAATEYEQRIRDVGGMDIIILGIGSNGHIGFNEPTSSLSSRTRIKTLDSQTRADNARFFADPAQVPTHCLTQGLGTIMDARRVVLVAQGKHKAAAIAAMIEGPVSSRRPGSVLQFHQHATIVIDEPAASELELRHYYIDTYEGKPSWQ